MHSKAEGVPLAEEPEAPKEAEVVDLVAAFRASVEAAKKRLQSPSARKRITGYAPISGAYPTQFEPRTAKYLLVEFL